MYIRRTRTGRAPTGEAYFSHRLVRTERVGDKVRQVTLMNLGRTFPVPKGQWTAVCERVEQLLAGAEASVETALEADAEREAQRITAFLLAAESEPVEAPATEPAEEPNWQRVDFGTLEPQRPRSVGVEQVGLWAMDQLGLDGLLADAGLNSIQRIVSQALIIARMARPGTNEDMHRWLTRHTGLGELLDHDLEVTDLAQLERTGQRLIGGERALQRKLFERIQDLLQLESTGALVVFNRLPTPIAATARVRVILLATVFDASGFIRQARVFRVRQFDPAVLGAMLQRLDAPEAAPVLLAPELATPAAIAWLQDSGRSGLVAVQDVAALQAVEQRFRTGPDGEDSGIDWRHGRDPATGGCWTVFPAGGTGAVGEEWLEALLDQLGALNGLLHALGDDREGRAGREAALDLSAFRKLRAGRLLTVLAYQVVRVILRRLAQSGIEESWNVLRDALGRQQRLTTRIVREDGSTLHVRQATPPEPVQQPIVRALGLDPYPGGRKDTVREKPARR